jgi:hypothetical protein
MTDLELALTHWQTMAELQVKFIEALGQYKAEVAKADMMAAVTAGEWAVARMKARVVQELEASLKRLTRLRATTARRVERLERHTRDLGKIRSGEDLPGSQLPLMWGAYTVFERSAPAPVLEKIIDTPLHASARLGSSYADPRRPRSTCPDPPETVDNVHALIGWLKRRGYVPRRGSQAYRQVIEAITAIGDSARGEIETLEKALREIEQGTYDTWQPVVIAALPDSVDAKKIIKLGSRT